jgi:hypothetical protein
MAYAMLGLLPALWLEKERRELRSEEQREAPDEFARQVPE